MMENVVYVQKKLSIIVELPFQVYLIDKILIYLIMSLTIEVLSLLSIKNITCN